MQAREGAALNRMSGANASPARSAGGIFGGITLIAIGGLLLARNFGYNLPVWGYIARYWPALLIVWGLLKLIDYYRFKNAGNRRPLFSGGELALLILVIFAGAAVTTAANISSDFGSVFEIGDVDLWDITGNNFTFEEHEKAAVSDGSTIEIVNLFGDVEVSPADTDRVLLDVKKTIRAFSKEEAERLSNDFTFSISNEGDEYRIASNRDGVSPLPGRIPRQRYKSSLIARVPKHSSLRVKNRNGKVGISDLGGDQDIANRSGAIDVRKITGDVKVSNSFGRVTIDSVKGNAVISGRNNSIEVQHIEGDVKADSSFQNVNIRNAMGSIAVHSLNGDLLVSFSEPVQKPVLLSTRFGNVTIELPANASFSVDAHTQFGRIDSDFEGVAKDRSDFAKESVLGQIGRGGPQITVSTFNGNIHLVRRS
jgi:hypothetical protein